CRSLNSLSLDFQTLSGLPGTHAFTYQYDTDGNLTRRTRPDGGFMRNADCQGAEIGVASRPAGFPSGILCAPTL
ncbi:MAG: hypothetical protein ACRCXD_07055, partial [Luteolibacter sp.]